MNVPTNNVRLLLFSINTFVFVNVQTVQFNIHPSIYTAYPTES